MSNRGCLVAEPWQFYTTWNLIHSLLESALEVDREEPVAHHLIGAMLRLRFPGVWIPPDSRVSAPVQLERPADFKISSTAFYVTTAPHIEIYQSCQRSLEQGLQVHVLVPDRILVGTRQVADAVLPGRIITQSVESFVLLSLEMLSTFNPKDVATNFRSLIRRLPAPLATGGTDCRFAATIRVIRRYVLPTSPKTGAFWAWRGEADAGVHRARRGDVWFLAAALLESSLEVWEYRGICPSKVAFAYTLTNDVSAI